MRPRVLVACVGNIFLSDDGFGVEVARRLVAEELPEGVLVKDFGIRGLHLAYEVLDGYDTLVLVDAAPRGERPGTVYVIEPDIAGSKAEEASSDGFPAAPLDAHDMSPQSVLALLESLGGHAGRVLVVGCEPETVEEGIGLSPAVSDAVDEAIRVILELVDEEVGGRVGKDG